jgi:CBS domain-containing protein
MQVREFYHPVAVSVDAGQSLGSAARRMLVHHIGSLAVLEDSQLVGIVTERDLARAVADEVDMASTPVANYVSFTAAMAAPDEDAQEVANRMLDLGVRHLPVVERDEVIGMLSVRDLLVMVAWQPAQAGPSQP